ncbi:hypothetical protein [Mucilaginibacter sp. FT3.2]|uniref:hypothetical protein n=1 Tax=Mucilaginibacter sp. FT3.2 TaxID=2723090 RepID=UPI0016148794|nr:hypothetical protein [Mucilaginibacter sp. FT3.2]MBB6234949.1 alkylated DNA nucleotide flippase Atl1 [Mucilaginibacter sp. FT3.2]
MNKHLFTGILLLLSISIQAQTARSGINNPSPTVTLDVTGNPTSTTYLDGIMAPRVTGVLLRAKTYTATQNSAIVYVTTADPAPAGQTINVTSVGYYYFSGPTLRWVRFVGGSGPASTIVGQILTADANGLGAWQTLALTSVAGVTPGPTVSFTKYGTGTPPNTILFTNGYIILPPGKWLVAFGTKAGIGNNTGSIPRILNTDASLWLTLYLSDDATTGGNTADYVTADSGPRGSAGVLGRGSSKTYVSGYEVVNNTGTASKKYYLWAYQEQDINPNITASSKTQYDNGSGTSVDAFWVNVMDNTYQERYFFAIPIQ